MRPIIPNQAATRSWMCSCDLDQEGAEETVAALQSRAALLFLMFCHSEPKRSGGEESRFLRSGTFV